MITRCLKAHHAHDTATAVTAFTLEATVIDDGSTYEGTEAIEGWLGRSSTEFTCTIHLVGIQQSDATHHIATHHLEGNFPGGTADLRYQFTLREDLIEHLVIDPESAHLLPPARPAPLTPRRLRTARSNSSGTTSPERAAAVLRQWHTAVPAR